MQHYAHTSASRSVYRLVFWCVILLAIAAVMVWKWTEKQSNVVDPEQSLAPYLANAGISDSHLRKKLAALQFERVEIARRLTNLEKKLQVEADKLSDLDNNSLRLLSNIEGLIVTADRYLQTKSDSYSALDLLKYSQALLLSSNTTADFSELNEALAEYIELLDASVRNQADVLSLNRRIADMSAQIDVLPMKTADSLWIIELPKEEEISERHHSIWHRYFLEVKQDIQQLVKIEKMDNAQIPLLSSTQIHFLKTNIKLQLMQARLALLERDKNNFYSAVKTVENLLQWYFDPEDLAVKRILADLKRCFSVKIESKLPDLKEVLKIVYHHQLMLEGGGK